MFVVTLAYTSRSLRLLRALSLTRRPWLETLAVAVATVLTTVATFVLTQRWMFAPTPVTHLALSRSRPRADQTDASLASPAAQ